MSEFFVTPWTVHSMEFSRPEDWSGKPFLLQGIFPTQGYNPGLPHWGRILYQLSHKGSPRILEWVAYPFSSRSSQPRNRTSVSCIAGGFFTNGAIREAAKCVYVSNFCLVKYKQSVYTVLSGDVLKKEPMLSPFIRTAPGSDGWPLAAVLEHGDKRQRTEKGKEWGPA